MSSRTTAAAFPILLDPVAPVGGRQSPNVRPHGMSNLGLLSQPDRQLLAEAWRDTMHLLSDGWEQSLAGRTIFWVNIWQLSNSAEKLDIGRIAELDAWVWRTAKDHYGSDIILDGYGLIVNPVGSVAQSWHLDYAVDYSTIFIPLTELTPENALQYLDLGDGVSEEAYRLAVRNPDEVDLQPLIWSGGEVAVRQVIAPPYSLLKLDFGAIHRGIGNSGERERVVFWISVRRGGGSLPAEPLFQVFDEDGSSRDLKKKRRRVSSALD